MYASSAKYYDLIYSFKDYPAEVEKLQGFIKTHKKSAGNALLDVACGTGKHLELLKADFKVEGLDLEPGFIEIAAARNPGIPFHVGDMTNFNLDRKFDVITCLFSAIGYATTVEQLDDSFRCMAAHLVPGGVLLVEPWFTPDTWTSGTVHGLYVDEPEIKIARLNISRQDGRLSFFDFHFLVGTPEEVVHFTERHELGLFTHEEMECSIRAAGLEPLYDEEGLMKRGLWIGTKAV
jgi:SAM-dependent methyltransferase